MAWVSLKQYKIAIAATASTALQMAEIQQCFDTNNVPPVARISTTGCGAVFQFGTNAVAADATETSSALPSNMVHIEQGAIETFGLRQSDEYFSVISDDELSTGVIWVDIGYGE
jgi:hypothetical protein